MSVFVSYVVKSRSVCIFTLKTYNIVDPSGVCIVLKEATAGRRDEKAAGDDKVLLCYYYRLPPSVS